MFEVGVLRKVEIDIQGEKLAHYFDELRGDEWLTFQRQLAELNGDGDTAKRILLLYDARCKKVEGYSITEQSVESKALRSDLSSQSSALNAIPIDLMAAHPDDWRDYIPGDHKAAAWLELITGDNLKKKLEANSKDSPTPSEPAQGK